MFKTGFIGAGKVACSFGQYLRKKGMEIAGYASRSEKSAEEAAALTGSRALTKDELVKEADYIFVTTTDDAIADVARELAGKDLSGKYLFHMSGAANSGVFNECKKKGAKCYSLHPLYSFADKNSYHLENTVFSVEGEEIGLIEDFLSQAGLNYFVIRAEDKIKYHAAAVFVSNYLVALAKIAENIFVDCGLGKEQCSAGVTPLIESTLLNIKKKGIEKALTGPIARGDIHTIEKHLGELGAYRKVYSELGLVALTVAEENATVTDEQAVFIKELLEKNCHQAG